MYCVEFVLIEDDYIIVRLNDDKGWAMSYTGDPSWVKHKILIEQNIVV